MSEKPTIVVITGPTGGGKSRVAVNIASRLGGEIVNADSVQVYRDFNIGSCTPTREECGAVPHHLYSVVEPDVEFDAGAFRQLAGKTISELARRQVLPILVGGTGLYIRSLVCGLVDVEPIEERAQKEVSAKETELANQGLAPDEISLSLHHWLSEIDVASAQKINPSDISRVRRALLVKVSSGCSLAELQQKHSHGDSDYRALVIALFPERHSLYQAVDNRVDEMLASGFVEEVRTLRKRYPLNSRPFNAIGYRHVGLYLDERLDYEEMVELLKRDTRRFAKRQLTWWRNQPETLGWKRPDLPDTNFGTGRWPDSISEHLVGVIEWFIEQKRLLSKGGVAFLPVEHVDSR